MSRFSNLEFESDAVAESPDCVVRGEAVRDQFFYRDRAVSAWLNGDFEEALLNYSKSVEEDGAYCEGWCGQVRMLNELGEYPESLLWIDKALALFPVHAELLAVKAVARLRQGELAGAMALSDQSLARDAKSYYVWVARAEVLLVKGGNAAETCAHNAVGVAGSDAGLAWLEGGRALLRGRAYAAAQGFLEEAAREFSKSALAWLELGRCQSALGFKTAENSLRQCLALRPEWRPALDAMNEVGGGLFSWFRRRR